MDVIPTLWMEYTEILKSKRNSATADHCALERDAKKFGTAQHHVPADGDFHIHSCDKLKYNEV